MTREEFEADLVKHTQLKLETLGLSLTPDNLWDRTEIFEDAVKEVLGCGKVLLSAGWDYVADSSLRVAFTKNIHEKRASALLNDLLTAEGANVWMDPIVSTVRGEELVQLTIPFAAPQSAKFTQTFFAVLDNELDRRFKLDEGTVFEVFKRQNYNFFVRKTDLLEHTLLEVLGYKELPEDCVTRIVGHTLEIDLRTPQGIDPDTFKKDLQLACEKVDGIQFSDVKKSGLDCSLHIPETALQGLDERFFSLLKEKLKNPELNKIYSEWSVSNANDKIPFLRKLREIKANAQKAVLSADLVRVAETVNLIINENSFSLSGGNDAEQEKLSNIIDKLRILGLHPTIYSQADDVAGNRTVETNVIYNYRREQLHDFLIFFEAISRNEPTSAFLKSLTQSLLEFDKVYADFLTITNPQTVTLDVTKLNENPEQPFTNSETNLIMLNEAWETLLQQASTLLDYKQSVGIDSSIPVLDGLFRLLPPVDHHHADEAIKILDDFAEGLMPIVQKVVCENQAGAKAAWGLYIHLLGQANNIVKYQQDNTRAKYYADGFKNLIPFHNEFSCEEQLEAAFLIVYIASGDVEGAKTFFYGHEKFADYRRELQEMTLKKFASLVDKVKQMEPKALFNENLSFKVLLLGLFVERREYLGQLVQTTTSVNTRSSFYQTTSPISAATATNVTVEPESREGNRLQNVI